MTALSGDEWYVVLCFHPEPWRAAPVCRTLRAVCAAHGADLPRPVVADGAADKRRRADADADAAPPPPLRPLCVFAPLCPERRTLLAGLDRLVAAAADAAGGTPRRLDVRLDVPAAAATPYALRVCARGFRWPASVEDLRLVLRLPPAQPGAWRTVLRAAAAAAAAAGGGKLRALAVDVRGGGCPNAVCLALAALVGAAASPALGSLRLDLRDNRFTRPGAAALAAALAGCPALTALDVRWAGNVRWGAAAAADWGAALASAVCSLRRLRLDAPPCPALAAGVRTHRATLVRVDWPAAPDLGGLWRLRAAATDAPVPRTVEDLTVRTAPPPPPAAAGRLRRLRCPWTPALVLPAGLRAVDLALPPGVPLAAAAPVVARPGLRECRVAADAAAALGAPPGWTAGPALWSLTVRLRGPAPAAAAAAADWTRLLTALCGVRPADAAAPLAVSLDATGVVGRPAVGGVVPPPHVHLRVRPL